MNRVVIKRDGLEKNFDITCIEDDENILVIKVKKIQL